MFLTKGVFFGTIGSMNKKVSRKIREIIHYDKENPSSRRNYRKAKSQYQKMTSERAKKDFLNILNDFYNKKEEK